MAKPMAWGAGNCPGWPVGGHLGITTPPAASREVINHGPGGYPINPCPGSGGISLTHLRAADAASHLFFAYLRSLSPDSIRGTNGISALPISLQTLVQATAYPPATPSYSPTAKVVMIVDSVSPTPFALLRRAKHFEYRRDDRALQEFSSYDDPIQALTEECQRVLRSISSTNESAAITSKDAPGLPDASWSRFEDIGFRGFGEYSDDDDEKDGFVMMKKRKDPPGLRSTPLSKSHDLGRPTTPSWADFLSSGFVDDSGDGGPAPLLLPHDKVLPPLGERGQSSQSHRRKVDDADLVPGELASITTLYLDDAFWWVWISSLAGEETTDRKAVFGRCALVETNISGGKWLVLEEIVKGAAPEPEEGAYIAEKKSRFGFSTRGRFGRTKSGGKKPPPPSMSSKLDPYVRNNHAAPASKVSIGPDQHARIQAAAAALQQKQRQQEQDAAGPRRARTDDPMDTKTNSVFTLQPVIMNEAAPAMKWASSYDKEAVRAAYLGDNFAGRGSSGDLRGFGTNGYVNRANESTTQLSRDVPSQSKVNLTNGFHREDSGLAGRDSTKDRDLPALPSAPPQDRAPAAPSHMPPPNSHRGVSNEAATQAAEVPLPTPTPMEGHQHSLASSAVLPPKQNFDDFDEGLLNGSGPAGGPAGGQENLNGGGLSQPSSPESKGGAKKLNKPPPGAGIKGFFGKKKPGAPTLPAPLAPVDTNAVAAARAAYVGPSMKPNYTATQSNLSRRLSFVGRKKVPPSASPPEVPPVSSAAPTEKSGAPEIRAPIPIPIAAKRFEPAHTFGMSSRSSLIVDTLEQRQGNRPVHRFDQGPLDQPAFVPEDSPDRQPSSPISAAAPPLEDHPANRKRSSEDEEVPRSEPKDIVGGREKVGPAADSESEEEESESPPLDRWAQIRKNAAERAARQNGGAKPIGAIFVEERSRGNNVTRTDADDADGETSGEESEF